MSIVSGIIGSLFGGGGSPDPRKFQSPISPGPQTLPLATGGGLGSTDIESQLRSQFGVGDVVDAIGNTAGGIGQWVIDHASWLLPAGAVDESGNIDWGKVGIDAIKGIGNFLKDNKETILQGLSAYNSYNRSNKSEAYAKDALAGAQKAYDAKAPLRTAGQAGMLNPQGPDISALRTQGQNGLDVKAPTPLPLATPNLANAQHLANGPGSSNPFTKTLPIAPPAAPPSLPPAQGSTPQAPPTLPIAPATPAVPGTAPTPAQLEGPHLPAPFSPTPPGFGQRKPGQMIRPLPLATY